MSLVTILAPDLPTIRLTGEINMATAYELIDEINLLHDYYQFRTISLEIDSPGGEADALHHIVESLAKWRKGEGRILRTRGLVEIASAAAMLLSLGTVGHRSAFPYSRLLYHSARTMFPSNSLQTYSSLRVHGKRLDDWDQKFLDMMAEHTSQIEGRVGNRAYRTKLKQLFQQERFITAQQACEMYLIDHVR